MWFWVGVLGRVGSVLGRFGVFLGPSWDVLGRLGRIFLPWLALRLKRPDGLVPPTCFTFVLTTDGLCPRFWQALTCLGHRTAVQGQKNAVQELEEALKSI